MTTSWSLTNDVTRKRLERAYSSRKIDVSIPGFCDSPNFLHEESKNRRFLETYEKYVEAVSYPETYLLDARRNIFTVAEAVRAAVEGDGTPDSVSMPLKSSLTLDFPREVDSEPLFFWPIDEGEFYASHAASTEICPVSLPSARGRIVISTS